MPKSEVLGEKCGSAAIEGDKGPQKQPNQASLNERIRAENKSDGVGPPEIRTSARRSTSASVLTPYKILARHRRTRLEESSLLPWKEK